MTLQELYREKLNLEYQLEQIKQQIKSLKENEKAKKPFKLITYRKGIIYQTRYSIDLNTMLANYTPSRSFDIFYFDKLFYSYDTERYRMPYKEIRKGVRLAYKKLIKEVNSGKENTNT